MNGTNGIDGTNGVNGIDGLNGTNGIDGLNGIDGIDGKDGISYVISVGMYSQLGSQFESIAAGQPFSFNNEIISSPSIIIHNNIIPAYTSSTIFELINIGIYEINYQMSYPTDGGIVLFTGISPLTMTQLPYTMIGKTTDGQIHGSVIVQTTVNNSFISLNAASNNSAAIVIPPNSSTTNMSSTTISIKQL
jgi:hypothetical protein